MKTIIVPTDFSDYADRAVRIGTQLAEKFGIDLVLFHCLEIPAKTNEEDEQELIEEIYNTRQNAELLFSKYTFPADISVRKVIRKGDVTEQFSEYLQTQTSSSMVVMGSHGQTGNKSTRMGSNAQKTVQAAKIPVLVIKKGFKLPLENVIFASDFVEGEEEVFNKFIEFILPFNPTIHLLYIKDSDFWDMTYTLAYDVMQKFADLAAPLKCKTHVQRNFSASKGILNYIEAHYADMVVVSNHVQHPIKRLFMGSTVETLVNHAKIPVLSFDFVEEETPQVKKY